MKKKYSVQEERELNFFVMCALKELEMFGLKVIKRADVAENVAAALIAGKEKFSFLLCEKNIFDKNRIYIFTLIKYFDVN